MLESFNTRSEMQYQRLTEEEKQKRGILGRLVGIIADFKNATRNGRRYTEELWDKTFDDPIVKEKIENRCILGELGHPSDRQETDIEKVAICLAEMPKKGDDGKLHGVFDILDTPNGRILKTLCDYGCNIGVSSRGGGDTFEDYNGNETVDPDSYEFECFDAVLLPAVKAARPSYVTEAFDAHKKTLKVALMEALEKSSENDQRVMKTTLEELNIEYTEDNLTNNPERVDNIEVTEETVAAEDDGANMINELHEALQRQQELESQVKSLQEKLSVCYTKESRYSDKLAKANSKVTAQETENKQLSEQLEKLTTENSLLEERNTELETKLCSLTESSEQAQRQVTELTESLNGYRNRYSDLKNQLKESKSSKTTLDESLSSKTAEVTKLTEAYSKLKEDSEKKLHEAIVQNKNLESTNKKLVEELQDMKKDSQIMKSQSNAKLEKAQTLVEKYKSIAKTAVEKYINSQAVRIGVSSTDIRNRLTESYSFKDIDKAVEDLQQYKLNVKSLPFSTLSEKRHTKAVIRESKEPLLTLKDNSSYNFDDDVDEALLTFTN